MTQDGEFSGRDEMGLEKKSKYRSEEEARAAYFKLVGGLVLFYSPLLSLALYFALRAIPGQAERIDAKFAFISEHDLGWVFVAAFLVFVTRAYLSINANGARAGARLDRPDQHIYKIMTPEKPLCDAPHVLMATTGAAGRFNRAQRGAFNFDESAAWFIIHLVLIAIMFGPLSFVLGSLQMYGRITFANQYKEDQAKRQAGFTISILAEYLSAGLISVCALKAFVPAMP